MKARSLQDLGDLKKAMAQRQIQDEAERQRRLKQERQAQAERELFSRTVGPVRSLLHTERVALRTAPAEPTAKQKHMDDQAVLRESLSDEFDVSTLLDVDDQMSYRAKGIGTDVTRRLRRGEWSIQGQIDLHGLRSDAARESLGLFVREAVRQGWRCLRVVHGKGLGSPGREPVLKSKVQRWLVQKTEVLAFVQAKPSEGGAGALLVLLR
ncbi:MAG: Smr/MutS family protein [Alphaproteobacteria bacterium]|nr:Smr/MutS family protein [Alphaproteobacteria bacterium]